MLETHHALRCWPRDDEAFARRVADVVVGLCPSSSDEDIEARCAALRADYPNARLVMQAPLAVLGTAAPGWYAYRDGTTLSRPDDGLGAMRYRPPTEELLRRSVDLSAIAAGLCRASDLLIDRAIVAVAVARESQASRLRHF